LICGKAKTLGLPILPSSISYPGLNILVFAVLVDCPLRVAFNYITFNDGRLMPLQSQLRYLNLWAARSWMVSLHVIFLHWSFVYVSQA
jgi:hypothetical protein